MTTVKTRGVNANDSTRWKERHEEIGRVAKPFNLVYRKITVISDRG